MIKKLLQKGFKKCLSRGNASLVGGFTLAEMMTVVAVMVIIMAIILNNQKKFDSDLELTNVAYRIAVEARQAQVYGISVRETSLGSGNFGTKYGLHFTTNQASFIFFKDVDDNGRYTPADANDRECSGNECVEKVVLGRGNEISGFCGLIFSTGQVTCAYRVALPVDDPTLANLYAIDTVFKRPKPDAVINVYLENYGEVVGSSLCPVNGCDGIAICLKSPNNKQKRVSILKTGQISVEDIADYIGVASACVDS